MYQLAGDGETTRTDSRLNRKGPAESRLGRTGILDTGVFHSSY